ncbi:protein of unknown function [Bradyrhizobium vignae]|uniref:Uncharacterized protein n=1 Tax=Bradyrhizobium vignae TaxID=1549949 RepID=A0A2U3Q9V8_9BRAD|nr:protein of unknown function [Bradyrhizobium vignae]
MKSIAAVELLILDDWGLQTIDANARHYLLNADAILDRRFTTLTGSN